MARYGKIPVFVALLALSVLAAGLFGMLHNQLSYSVGSAYFHDFKFLQFGLDPALHNRWGAALVGWKASWWMGLLIGLPVTLFGAFWVLRPANFLTAGLSAIGVVIVTTLLMAMFGLMLGMFGTRAPFADAIPVPVASADPGGFLRAAFMHDAAYLGGFAGLFLALLAVWRIGRLERQQHAAQGGA